MGASQATTAKGKAAAKSLLKNARKEEAKVEAKTGKDIPKGEKRVIERSKASDGKGPGVKQK